MTSDTDRHMDIEYMARAAGFAIALVMVLCLGGCVTTGGGPQVSSLPVCEALIGPITYNSTVPASRRHAGPDLAADLAVRNRVGKNLRCPAYR